MLDHLRVRNLGVLEEAAIDPSPGLTVITGETGAGKTLLLGGLRLMLGEKADSSAVGPAADAAQADGLFSTGDAEMGVTRVVPRDGRSRAHLDGSIVSAAALGENVGGLVEIVGQHDHIGLRRQSQVLSLIDGALDEPGAENLDAYRAAWAELEELRKRQSGLGGNEMALRQELDLVRFQATEIDAAALEAGEDESLEAEAARHRNLEEIQELMAESLQTTENMVEEGGEVVSRMRRLASLDPASEDLAGQAEEIAASLTELGRAVRESAESLEVDPRRAEEVTERLNLIGDMKRKYGKSLDEVIAFGEQAQKRLTELEGLLSAASRIEADLEDARQRLAETGEALTASRLEAADRIVEETQGHLADLGLEGARLIVECSPTEPGPSGSDQVSLLFSSDARLEAGPISSVASGGELSRLVLAVRLATRSPGSETLVFDEVDAGVGGATALAMGRKLAALAETHQVLCVTHLPQLAAFADAHYVVERTESTATVRRVEGDERLQEISRMLAGLPESEAGQDAAAELLEAAAN